MKKSRNWNDKKSENVAKNEKHNDKTESKNLGDKKSNQIEKEQ